MDTKSDKQLDERLKRLFTALEGPSTPLAREPDRRSIIPRWLLAAAAGAAAVTLSALGIASVRDSPLSGDSTGEGSCASSIRYDARTYFGNSFDSSTITAGDELGTGETLCGQRDTREVVVRAVAGVNPTVAILNEGEANVVYLAPGRCTGVDLEICLRQPLRFLGREYTATTTVEYLEPGESVGEGLIETTSPQRVVVHAAGSADPRVAVKANGLLYVAVGACEISNPGAFVDCVRG